MLKYRKVADERKMSRRLENRTFSIRLAMSEIH
jgi:hypothetical protein